MRLRFECSILLSHQVWHDFCIDTFGLSVLYLCVFLSCLFALFVYFDFVLVVFFIWNAMLFSRLYSEFIFHTRILTQATTKTTVRMHALSQNNTPHNSFVSEHIASINVFEGPCGQNREKRQKLKLIVHGAVW